MKLLIVTQKVDKNDDNLGFFYGWIEEFAKHCEKVVVIAGSSAGEAPAGAEVLSLGKAPSVIANEASQSDAQRHPERQRGISRLLRSLRSLAMTFINGFIRLRRLWKFWELFSYHYARSDAVFFHMIPEFVLAASPFLISLKKPTALWYAHKSVPRPLRIAERWMDFVFTSSAEGFRLPSKKVYYVGQAINTEIFRPATLRGQTFSGKSDFGALRLITAGRISPVKNYETIIQACALLKKDFPREWQLSIVGGPLLARDQGYFDLLKKLVAENDLSGRIIFHGARPYTEIPDILREHDLFINLSGTGSLDKAVLEAMSTGLTVITSNPAYRSILPPQYFLERINPQFLAERIKALADENRPNLALRDVVVRHHALEQTVNKIISVFSQKL